MLADFAPKVSLGRKQKPSDQGECAAKDNHGSDGFVLDRQGREKWIEYLQRELRSNPLDTASKTAESKIIKPQKIKKCISPATGLCRSLDCPKTIIGFRTVNLSIGV